MTFDSIFDLLAWYVRSGWLRGPRAPGNHDWTSIPSGIRHDDLEDIWITCLAIKRVIDKLSNRDGKIIVDLFEESRPCFKTIGLKYCCSAKTISRIRWRVLPILERGFEEEGLLTVKAPEEPQFYKGDSCTSLSG